MRCSIVGGRDRSTEKTRDAHLLSFMRVLFFFSLLAVTLCQARSVTKTSLFLFESRELVASIMHFSDGRGLYFESDVFPVLHRAYSFTLLYRAARYLLSACSLIFSLNKHPTVIHALWYFSHIAPLIIPCVHACVCRL